MALREELELLIAREVSKTPIAKLLLEHGREGLLDTDINRTDVIVAVGATLKAHRDCLLLLADEIDALRT